MGPIRAFSRPSHGLAAGEYVTSASPYSHTPGYSAARRPCCAHSSSPLGSHHSALPHQHLYGTVCAIDPLRAGLVSSPAASPTCLLHFKKILPPGAASPDTHLAVPAQRDTRGASQGAARDAEGSERRRDILESGWKDGREYERKSTEERKSKNKSGEKKLKKSEEGSKSKQQNGAHKRHERKSDSKWEKFGDNYAHKKNKEEIKWKNKNDSLTWKKHQKEQRWRNSEEENDFGSERREGKWSKNKVNPASDSSPATKSDDPCTSRMPLVFPFSDDDDDGYGHDGEGEKESNEEPWPISDIVETEDEEGESKTEHTEDPSREDCEGDGSLPQRVNSVVNNAEAAGVLQKQQLTPAVVDNISAITQNGNSEREENFGSVLPNTQERHDSPSTGEKHVLHKDYGTDEELQLEEQVEHESEDKRRSGEEDWPKDGIRATQRLRPRSYRQFLMTRERRSRVFLKARSYHLGRWFVTHFTHPYPSKDQKDQLAARTSMNRNQVSEWFGNMRRRIREATRGLGVCWEERVRLYNTVITGKSEPLPIQPGDAINTWVPPVAEEPPSLDTQEEVCASPKFKKALMQRYLNNSFEAPPHHASGEDIRPPSMPVPLTALEVDANLSQGHRKVSESPKLNAALPHPLPLCTSSPKESFQARWNTSFQQVKDTKFPAVTARLLDKTDMRVRPFGGGKEEDEEEGRVVKKYERQKGQDYSCATFKKQKTQRDHFQSSSPCASSSLLPESRQSTGSGWRTLPATPVAATHFPSSPWPIRKHCVDGRSSDEEGAAGRYVRKPEELAAAYTLMALHTDAAAAHLVVAPPRPPPLSS